MKPAGTNPALVIPGCQVSLVIHEKGIVSRSACSSPVIQV
jgi:hypothetical protein